MVLSILPWMRPGLGVEYFTLDEARLGMVLSILPWMRPGLGVEYFTLDEARLGMMLSISSLSFGASH